jgi:hypothetical protein
MTDRMKKTQLETRTAQFISLICDVSMMKQQMVEIGKLLCSCSLHRFKDHNSYYKLLYLQLLAFFIYYDEQCHPLNEITCQRTRSRKMNTATKSLVMCGHLFFVRQ